IILPKNFKSIDYITYKGKFTGFVTDFVAYGLIKTNLGTIESDLSFKPDTSGYFKLNGRLSTTDFNLGTFVNKYKRLGDISLNVLVNGQVLKDKYLKMRLDGKINSVVWNGYKYQNIKLDGTLSNSYYDGFFAITDPNLTADFMGKINLAGQTPMYNFKADIKKANLFKLNFDKSDSNSYLS